MDTLPILGGALETVFYKERTSVDDELQRRLLDLVGSGVAQMEVVPT